MSLVRRWLVHALVLLAVVAVSLYVERRADRADARLEAIAVETHESLCALKNDLQRRHAAGVEFLQNNPTGIPGISAVDIQRSLENQRATLEALAGLDCR